MSEELSGSRKPSTRSLAAEFPNDNPALHAGVTWLCLDTTGASVPVSAAPEAIAGPVAQVSGIVSLGETPRDHGADEPAIALEAHDLPETIVIEELPPLDGAPILEGDCGSSERRVALAIAPPPPADPWTVLLSTLMDVAMAAGSPHVASLIPGLLLEGRVEPLSSDVTRALAEARVLQEGRVTPAFLAQTRAWRGMLLGNSDDLAACGSSTLDEWAADLLARLLGAASRANGLKRELRARGVAAFGLVDAAA